MISLLLLAQWALALVWWPFQALSRALRALSNGVGRLGDALVRVPYWAVIQAKRRRLGEPLWQQHDFMIGMGPPCESCGEHVPPGRHRSDCTFLRPMSLSEGGR